MNFIYLLVHLLFAFVDILKKSFNIKFPYLLILFYMVYGLRNSVSTG